MKQILSQRKSRLKKSCQCSLCNEQIERGEDFNEVTVKAKKNFYKLKLHIFCGIYVSSKAGKFSLYKPTPKEKVIEGVRELF